jgi:hypothetical protein
MAINLLDKLSIDDNACLVSDCGQQNCHPITPVNAVLEHTDKVRQVAGRHFDFIATPEARSQCNEPIVSDLALHQINDRVVELGQNTAETNYAPHASRVTHLVQ